MNIEQIMTEAFAEKAHQEHNANVVLRARMAIVEAILLDIRDKIEGENDLGEWTAYIYEQAGLALKELNMEKLG